MTPVAASQEVSVTAPAATPAAPPQISTRERLFINAGAAAAGAAAEMSIATALAFAGASPEAALLASKATGAAVSAVANRGYSKVVESECYQNGCRGSTRGEPRPAIPSEAGAEEEKEGETSPLEGAKADIATRSCWDRKC